MNKSVPGHSCLGFKHFIQGRGRDPQAPAEVFELKIRIAPEPIGFQEPHQTGAGFFDCTHFVVSFAMQRLAS